MALFFLLAICFATTVKAQSHDLYEKGKEQYRVVAYMSGEVNVSSVSNQVTFIKSTTLYLPNAFSPDQDGVNDTFGIIGENVANFNLKIYNRWGELLFETSNTNERWDGTYRGKQVAEGVYVYTLIGKEVSSGRSISKTGTVSLLL